MKILIPFFPANDKNGKHLVVIVDKTLKK